VRVLLDEDLPVNLRHYIQGHDVETVTWKGWKGIKNGKLLDLAEQEFDVFITFDQNLHFQQNISKRKLGIIVLVASNDQLHSLLPLMPSVEVALLTIAHGEWVYIEG
jgi:predicted nuclease of predicted toxin-antitoxin system